MTPRRRASTGSIQKIRPPSRIRIFLRSLDHRVVDQAAIRLTETAERTGATIEGPIPLPSVPAPVDGMRTHVRQIDLVNPTPEIVATLAHVDLPSGVEIEMAG